MGRLEELGEGGCGTFVDEDERQVVAGGVFLVDFAEGGGEVETAEEEADGDRFSCLIAGLVID